MSDLTWVSVAQPLYVARTGMERQDIRLGPDRTAESWEDTLSAAQSGLESFCKPERVYAMGVSEIVGVGPAYLTAINIYHDAGQPTSEVYVAGDDPTKVQAEARQWVRSWEDRATNRLRELAAATSDDS